MAVAGVAGGANPRVPSHFQGGLPYRKRSASASLADLESLVSDDELEELLDATLSFKPREAVLQSYEPTRVALLKASRFFSGTIIRTTWPAVVANTLFAAAVVFAFWQCGGHSPVDGQSLWGSLWRAPPAAEFEYLEQLFALDKVWHYLQALTTFTLSFFLNQAYGMFTSVIALGRKVQGRLNDVGMLFAQRAKRESAPGGGSCALGGGGAPLDPDAVKLCERAARYVRLFSLLFYAGQTRRHAVLQTGRGVAALVRRGALSDAEARAILAAEVPPSQRCWVVTHWLVQLYREGLDQGLLEGDRAAAERALDARVHELRAAAAAFGDATTDRVPLPYTHFVQMLVDAFVMLAPAALFPEMGGGWCVLATAMLTLFYHGLLDLAKSFIDPLDNEDAIALVNFDTMIAESNAGSLRWLASATPPLPPAA